MKVPWIIAPVLLGTAALLSAADGDRTVVKLQINRNVPAWSGHRIDFGEPGGDNLVDLRAAVEKYTGN